jgi:hypothetical protein
VGSCAGSATTAQTGSAVPITSHTTPGSTTPAPSVAAISSPAPSTTRVAPSRPVASRSQSSIGPSTAWAARTGARRSGSTPKAAHASSDHSRARGSSTPVEDAFEGSTASVPDARQATHEPGSANTAAASWASGSFRASQATFGATWPGSRLQPVSSRRRAGSMPAAAHSAPARRSHQISAGRSGVPSASAATSPSSCEPNERATISRPAVSSRTRDSVATSAAVHSAGSCSAQPARG